ncbi:MAG TPA: TonB-dependent receptor [Chitinophagaceae bacterium]
MRKLLVTLTAILLFAGGLLAQKTITGTVTDDKGSPIPNASVLVKGTNTGTITKADGTYSIVFPENAKALVFSAVDMSPLEVIVGSQSVVNTSLKAVESVLAEVVVVGYGTQQKKAFTGSASKVDVKKFANLMTPSVDKQLAGRAAGVQVTTVGGQINAPARIRVRGINSINQSNDPLIVMDGVPIITGNLAGTTNSNALGDINPSDIETIDILKDGSATAIYGSRAAGGVILITTKKGSKGRAKVSYDGFIGFSSALKRFDLLNAQQFVTIANEKLANVATNTAANPQAPRAFMDANNTNTDWQDEAMVSGAPVQSHTLSVQGGNEKTSYYMSMNYSDQQGIIISNFNRAYRIRLSIDHEINSFVKVGNGLTISRQEDGDQNNGSNALSGAIASALRLLPNVSPYNPNHITGYNINYPTGNSMNPGANTTSVDDNFTNVAFTVNENKYYSDKFRILNNTYLEISPVKGLKVRSQFSYDLFTDYSYYGWLPYHGDGYGTSSGGTNGRINNISQNISRYIWQNYINYNLSIKNVHNIFLTAGWEMQQDRNTSHSLNNNNISDAFFIDENYITNTAATQTTGGSVGESGLESSFARLNYDYKNKYFAQATIRRDGLSSLASENRYGVFPGFSVGWRPSEEGFWKGSAFLNKWIPEAKIKGSYAEVGNPIGGFPYLSTYSSRPYGNIPGISVAAIGNPALQWETSAKYDIGVELGLLRNRFTLVADWFSNDISGMILNVPTPLSVGIPGNSITQNIATMKNNGIELSLSGNILRKKDFSWDFNINYSNIKNEITSLYNVGGQPVSFIQSSNYNIIRVGDPINILFGNVWAGVNTANGHPMYVKADGSLVQLNLSPGGSIGGYFVATSKDNPALGAASSLQFSDRQNLGVSTPVWFGGFSNTLSYKGLTLDFMLRYSGGNKIMNITRQEALMNQSFQNNGTEILERWTTPGQVTNVPKLFYGQANNINQNSLANSRFVEKGDYLRLENVILSYNVNPEGLNKVTNSFIKSLRIYAQGQNLAVWTKYKGADPDNISTQGLDNAVAPQLSTISFGINLGL